MTAGYFDLGETADILVRSVVPIPGTDNVRDIGGFPAQGGLRIRRGEVYRAEALAHPGAGVARVALWRAEAVPDYRRLRLRAVIDLRGTQEAIVAPSAWAEPSGAALHTIPIDEGAEGDATNYVRDLKAGLLRTFTASDLAAYYARSVRTSAMSYGRAIGVIADSGPVLAHCSAGKDRTGILIALLLESLGTPRDLVVADYAYTGVLRPRRVLAYADVLQGVGVEPEAVSALFETPAEAMAMLLAGLDAEFGSVRAFLADRAGIDDSTLEALGERLLEPTSPASQA